MLDCAAPAPVWATNTCWPAPFTTANSYRSGMFPANMAVELLTVRTTLSPWLILTPLIGETGVGALTLRVDPSPVAAAFAVAAPVGEVGEADCLLQPAASAIAHTLEANQYFRLIDRSLPH